jgi:hypothetical protein
MSTLNITVAPSPTGSYSGTFTVTGVPSGGSASVSPDPITLTPAVPTSATLTVGVPLTQIANYTVTVTLCASSICKSTNVTVDPTPV